MAVTKQALLMLVKKFKEDYLQGMDYMSLEEADKAKAAWRKSVAKEYDVPESEASGWADRPVSRRDIPGAAGKYYPSTREVALAPWAGGGTLAHEMAHANYFEEMPKLMRGVYPFAQWATEALDPQYREAVGSYGGSYGPISKGHFPVEGYAQGYSEQQIPWQLEPFYGNLKYPVPSWMSHLPATLESVGWAGSWLADKLMGLVR